ncbi:hypothetical protein BJ875DRAFT_493842 [Amylocarpus encephaloides]|uniref:GAG-pre-integrase domain-containing protein n=1 Tax=Amylocarpus encephaloides TaxID=45428 RepID=A0A9P7YNH0_9HELO|nr:hypothetical protein BJ875DRAFT_493842 [Amylocarpus encephaloides]
MAQQSSQPSSPRAQYPFAARFWDTIKESMMAQDPAGVWEALKIHDRATDQLFVDTMKEQFIKLGFDPAKNNIGDFVGKLREYQMQLSTSFSPISNAELLTRLLGALPKTTAYTNARLFCQQEQPTIESKATASYASNSNKSNNYNNSTRGGRGCGNHGGRGRSGGRHNKSDNSNRVNKPSTNKDKCRFCDKAGYFGKDCRIKERASRDAFDTTRNKGDDSSKNETSNAAYEYTGSIHFASEFTNASTITSDWTIDSGASKHFTYSSADFTQMKRWATPRKVQITDGGAYDAIGYDTVTVTLDTGLLELEYQPSSRAAPMNGLYLLSSVSSHIADDTGDASSSMGENKRENDYDLWHRRLGHLNSKYMEQLKDASEGIEYKKEPKPVGEISCEGCLAGKMKSKKKKSTNTRTTQKISRLNADISGKLPMSIRDYQYILLVADDATRCGLIELLKRGDVGTTIRRIVTGDNEAHRLQRGL